jgi:hypothetical protein
MSLQHITRYARPSDFADFAGFAGFNRAEYYVVYSQHRDSDSETRSNFRALLRRLGGESDTVRVVRDGHYLVGWVESIYVHESDTARLQLADELLGQIADYPILDEDDWSALVYDEAADSWARMSLAERVSWCQRYDVSIFAARRAELPDDPRGELIAALAS